MQGVIFREYFSKTIIEVIRVGKQMICAKYDSRKLTVRFAQRDDSRNSMDVLRKQAAKLCFFQIKI